MGPEGRGRNFRRRQEGGSQGSILDNEPMDPSFTRQVEDGTKELIKCEMAYGEPEAQRGAVVD